MMDCYCDYDPPSFYESSTPKARKQHRCEECGGPIVPGEKYEYVTGLWDGEFSYFKTCERCVDLRTWVRNNVPCLCWRHGSADDDCKEAVEDACSRAPTETAGLRFGLLRRIVIRDRLNDSRSPNRKRSHVHTDNQGGSTPRNA